MPAKYGHMWHSTSILGSWNSHWIIQEGHHAGGKASQQRPDSQEIVFSARAACLKLGLSSLSKSVQKKAKISFSFMRSWKVHMDVTCHSRATFYLMPILFRRAGRRWLRLLFWTILRKSHPSIRSGILDHWPWLKTRQPSLWLQDKLKWSMW